MIRRALLAVVALSAIANAQPKPDDSKVDAQSLMQSGVKLLEAKDYLGALAVFKTAYERFQGAKILLNIGTTLKLLGRDADAANAYQRYLEARDTDPKRKGDIEKLIAKLDKTVGKYEITPTPSNAQSAIDDDDWLNQVHGAAWRVTAGTHAVIVKADGYETKTKQVKIGAGEDVSLEIQLTPIPKPVARIITVQGPATGVVVIAKPEGPRSRFGAIVTGNFDIPNGGAAVVGITADIIDRVTVRGGAILGPKVGGYAGATFAFLTGQYRPYVTAGAPIFASHGARYGIRGGAGLEYEVNRHIAFVIEAAVEHEFNPEMDVTKKTLFVPAIGVVGRL
jgi:hypothetical protein